MNKIICNSVEFVFSSEIRLMTPAQITLIPGAEWKKLNVTEKPVYHSDIKQAAPGPTKEETVTAVTKHDSESIIKQYSNFPVVLKMKTDSSTFFVGSQRYPVITEISGDRIFDTYTFKSKSTP